MLPSLDRLSLHTGEFYPLSQAEVDQLNRDGAQEPFSTEPYQQDVGEYGLGGFARFLPGTRPNDEDSQWHTFRVRSTEPSADGTYNYTYYRAESLWRWHKTNPGDPLTREPIWYEDWWALRERFDPTGEVPMWVFNLPIRDQGTTTVVREVQRQPRHPWINGAPAGAPNANAIELPPMTRTFDNRAERFEQRPFAAERAAAFATYREADATFERALRQPGIGAFFALLDAQRSADEAQALASSILLRNNPPEFLEYEEIRQASSQRREEQVAQVREQHDAALRLMVADTALVDDLRAKQLAWDRASRTTGAEPTLLELEVQDAALRVTEQPILEAFRAEVATLEREQSRTMRQAQLDYIQEHRTRRTNAINRWRQWERGALPSGDVAFLALRKAWSGFYAVQELSEYWQRSLADRRAEAMETDLETVSRLNGLRQDWNRLTASPNPSRESLDELDLNLRYAEAQVISMFSDRLSTLTNEDPRAEATRNESERAFDGIGAERIRRRLMIEELMNPTTDEQLEEARNRQREASEDWERMNESPERTWRGLYQLYRAVRESQERWVQLLERRSHVRSNPELRAPGWEEAQSEARAAVTANSTRAAHMLDIMNALRRESNN